MQPVAVGLIGVGFHARTVHIPALDLAPELRLAAVAASHESTASAAAARYRVPGYADYRELLEYADVEAVIIATPTHAHEAICRAAFQSGKHVLIETPGIPDIPAARELLSLAQKKRLVAQVGFLTRYSQPFEVLRSRLIEQPSPRLFTYEYFPYLSHTYNLALYLSGRAERVLAATSDASGSTATVRFHNGDTAVIIGRALANCSVDIETVRVSTGTFFGAVEGRRRVRIIENMQPTGVDAWSTATSGGSTYEPQPFAGRFSESTGAAPQLRAFAAAIRTGTPPRSTLEDAIETQLLMNEAAAKAE
ncbi:MAG TPA: Gfo/Idh/MocA family oxidoreductase [Abditibacteriaceae bacterium]|nr:Gfo/Idh/MocA family oxidoreductase [Abditibacteriaceae bacterium]